MLGFHRKFLLHTVGVQVLAGLGGDSRLKLEAETVSFISSRN